MRVLCATVPADGHFNPVSAIAVELLAGGHDVRCYAGPHYQERLEELGVPGLPYVRASEVTGDNIHELYPERAGLKGPRLIAFDSEKVFTANVEHYYRDIADIRRDFHFDVFVCDVGFYASRLVAEGLGVPVYAVSPGPLMAGPGVPPPFFGLRPPRTVIGRTVHGVVRAMVHKTLGPAVATYNATLAAEGTDVVRVQDFFSVAGTSARQLFLVGTPGLDFPQFQLPTNAVFVGPLLPPGRRDRHRAPLPTMVSDAEATVIAISQGTVDNADPSKLIEPALEALHDQPFVLVVTTGGKNTAELRAAYPQANVLIEDYLSYDDLFDHVDVFVTNGGAGSVLSAMTRGVPVVSAGTREAKNDINARIAYNGLGVDLRTEHPKPHDIERAVRRVLDSETIKANVARVREELASYDPMAIIRHRLDADVKGLTGYNT